MKSWTLELLGLPKWTQLQGCGPHNGCIIPNRATMEAYYVMTCHIAQSKQLRAAVPCMQNEQTLYLYLASILLVAMAITL